MRIIRDITYDAAGRIASMTDYNGHTISYTYTARGELASITAPGSKVWTFAYNALGQRTQYRLGKGYSPVSLRSLGTVPFSSEYVYDTENRLTSILHKDASNNTVLDSFAYTLNDGGNITRIDHADNSYWAYDYDNRDRLTGATRHNTLGGLLHWFNYTYDAADNMTQRWRFQASNSQMDTWNFTYNSTNEQVSMTLNGGTPETRTYDALGRLATRTQGSYSASYGYRYNSRLYQATSNFPGEKNVTLDYGGDGKLRTRVTAAETRRYRYAMGYNAINEESDSELGAANVFEPGTLSGQRLMTTLGNSLTASPVYAYHDHLGTPRRWRLGNKSIARTYEYDPYGNIYASSGIFTTIPRIYALHEFEPALQHYRAPFRHYRPTMARWTTLDPLGMIDGPNMYGYVGGKAISKKDPCGLTSNEPNEQCDDACKSERAQDCQKCCGQRFTEALARRGGRSSMALNTANTCCHLACTTRFGNRASGPFGDASWSCCVSLGRLANDDDSFLDCVKKFSKQ